MLFEVALHLRMAETYTIRLEVGRSKLAIAQGVALRAAYLRCCKCNTGTIDTLTRYYNLIINYECCLR